MNAPNTPTTYTTIPPEMLAAHGLTRNSAAASSFNCTDPQALKIPTTGIAHSSDFRIKWDTARHLLRRIQNQEALEPIVVTRRPGNCEFVLIDGLHRLLIAIAVGFPSMPVRLVSYEHARGNGFL